MASVASTELGERLSSSARIESIDFLRGLIMVIMAIDHIRDFFHYDAFFFSPSDVTQTTPAIFFTRWITHLCSPGFIFLAGVSAYFIRQRKSRGETAYFLVTRGLWLIILQFTVIRLAWNFDPLFHYNGFTIISVIGVCMILLAGLIYLPWSWILIFSLVMIGGHNLLDGISFPSGSVADVIWSVLHVHKLYHLSGGYSLEVLFPIIPWVGVMSLGYCFGKIYDSDFSVADRRRIWLRTGVATLVVLFVLRYINVYGDPVPWSQQANWWRTFLSYLNFEKYPPSLYYVGIMLGILFVILGAVEGRNLDRWKPVTLFGKVALFYYVLHLFVIHLFALIGVVIVGLSWKTMIYTGLVKDGSALLKGKFGFDLMYVYVIWIVVLLVLYPFCNYWEKLKVRHRGKWWVSYV